MKITVLGCGSSGGVPLIGGNWGNCDPTNPRNRRTRVSILVEQGDTSILVDTTPDMRQQCLANGVKKIDAVLYTHPHADHTHGIDDLRRVKTIMQKSIDIYADPVTLAELKLRFHYIFGGDGKFYQPSLIGHQITGMFDIGSINVIPFFQNHGNLKSLGFRFGDFAYSTDVHSFDDSAWDILHGVKIWVVDCLRIEPSLTHSHLQQTLEWIEKLKPERAYLTHMNHHLDYDKLLAVLPKGIEPAYDGLVIQC